VKYNDFMITAPPDKFQGMNNGQLLFTGHAQHSAYSFSNSWLFLVSITNV